MSTNRFRGLRDFFSSLGEAPARPDASPPSVAPLAPERPRAAVGLSLPHPELSTTRGGKKKIGEFQSQLTEGVALMEHMVRYQEAQDRLETSTQQVEQTFARGGAELRKLTAALSYEERSLELQIEQRLSAQRQAKTEEERERELDDLQYEIDRHRKRAELAQAKEQARAAELHEEEQRARVERRRASAPEEEPEDFERDAPPEVQAVLTQQAKQRDARRWAQRQRERLLQSVGGDETRLSQRQRDELDDIETAAAAAQEAINTQEATAIVWPKAS